MREPWHPKPTVSLAVNAFMRPERLYNHSFFNILKEWSVMKNLKKTETAVILLTLLCLFFTAGYFVGRGTAVSPVNIDKLPSVSKSGLTEGSSASEGSSGTGNDLSVSGASDTTGNRAEININTASLAELVELPGIGDVIAQRIIDYRASIGGFKRIDQIQSVKGIGEKIYGGIKDLITVG